MKKNNKQEKPNWFHGVWYTEGDTVNNPFTGDSCKLTGPELSMYDFIKGAEFTISMQSNDVTVLHPDTVNLQNDMRKGLDWFRTANPSAYMTLLD
tara:strand:- start:113 stop:397 length:285 start_codon:yes stop_codon:yes gene_type:complete